MRADCGFCSYDILEKVEEDRNEEFYVPDRLFENSKKDASEKKRFGLEDFTKDDDGNYICPAGTTMKPLGVIINSQGDVVEKYSGTGCAACPLKEKCTKATQRFLHVDLREGYCETMCARLNSDEGREIYMKRPGLVEPLHGDDQKDKGWTQHRLRGLEKATGEFILVRFATNLAKTIKYKTDDVFMLALSGRFEKSDRNYNRLWCGLRVRRTGVSCHDIRAK